MKMPKDRHGRTKLSKSVLEMKFMKRSKQRILAEEEAEHGRSVHECEISEEMKNASDQFVIVPSYVQCQDLIIGRVSYGGMNPEIEKLMKPEDNEKTPDPSRMETDVTNWEMLKLSNVAQTVANKFSTKKTRNKAIKRLKNED